MEDDYPSTLRQIEDVRGYAIADELETVKRMLAWLPSRTHLCHTVLMATVSMWALITAATLLMMQ